MEIILMLRAVIFGWMLFGATTTLADEALNFARVEYRAVEQSYSVEGLVEATRQSTVSAQISGRIKEINFDVGDRVKQGQVILRIDERETGQELASRNAQVLQAQATLSNAKATYERSKQLFAQNFISQAALDKAEVDYQVARAQAAVSEASAGQASLSHGYSAVVAPYSGTVAARLVEVGEMVMPGKPMMVGFDPAELRVVAKVPQYRLPDIGLHPKVFVEVPVQGARGVFPRDLSVTPAQFVPNRWIKAAAVKVQPMADKRTHTTEVRVTLPANEAGIYPGMSVRTHFMLGKVDRLVIPGSAVIHRSEVVAVYVIEANDAVKLRQVRLGETTVDGAVEVLSGLTQGEKVALDPVKAGMK